MRALMLDDDLDGDDGDDTKTSKVLVLLLDPYTTEQCVSLCQLIHLGEHINSQKVRRDTEKACGGAIHSRM